VVRALTKASAVVAMGAAVAVFGLRFPQDTQAASGGCPLGANGRTARVAQVDGVLAAARRAVIDHKSENIQGQVTRRTTANFPVIEVVELSSGPPVPGQEALTRIAISRCGKLAAHYSWAVIFTDTQSVLCCVREIVFVVLLKHGWNVY